MRTIITKHSGFAIIELLLGIGIISVMAGATIVSMNTKANLTNAYDAERHATVNAFVKGMNNYHWDKQEMLVENQIPDGKAQAKRICAEGVSQVRCDSLGGLLLQDLVPLYMSDIPQDPSEQCKELSGFALYQQGGRALALALHWGMLPREHTDIACPNGDGEDVDEEGELGEDEEGEVGEEEEDDERRMTICHSTGGKSGKEKKKQTLTIDATAWESHQKHGDTEGECEEL